MSIVLNPRIGQKNTKRSYGILLIRYRAEGAQKIPEILLVCRRYTYAFYDFCNGRYSNPQSLFDKMTIDEKLDISSGNFDRLWYRLWLNEPVNKHIYNTNLRRFNILYGDGKRINTMLTSSLPNSKIWELPKGRSNNRETDYECALREFSEETNIDTSSIRLIPDIQFTIANISGATTYITKYYTAIQDTIQTPNISFDHNDQIKEIGDIKWWPLEALKTIVPTFEPDIRNILKVLKQRRKAATRS